MARIFPYFSNQNTAGFFHPLRFIPLSNRTFCTTSTCSPTPPFIDRLTDEVRLLDIQLRPHISQFKKKRQLFDKIKPILEQNTSGQLLTFGSCENGFWTRDSDVDSCLVLGDCHSKSAGLSKLRLISALLKMHGVGETNIVAAQVPVAKILDGLGGNICDISINNVAALANSKMVTLFCALDPRVAALGRVLKCWAKSRNINDRAKGTLSTYTILLQLFYLLQTRSPPILPLFQDILSEENMASEEETSKNGTQNLKKNETFSLDRLPFRTDVPQIREELLARYGVNTQSLGQLLTEFFNVFGDERFRGGDLGVSVKDGSEVGNETGSVIFVCPITGKNVNPFSITAWRLIYAEYKRANLLLASGKGLEVLCAKSEITPLERYVKAKAAAGAKLYAKAKSLGL